MTSFERNGHPLSRGWKWFLALSLLLGALLRLSYVQDMEYKEDEQLNFTHSQTIGTTEGWPWVGMPSGVYVANPGMSYWVFAALAKVSNAKTPTKLATSVQVFSLLGISLLIPFVLFFLGHEKRDPWLWAFALACVNPIAVYYQRKLWPEPFLPFFILLFLMGWWTRGRPFGAFLWGLAGALLGQIHMSGFFLAGGFFLWALVFFKRDNRVRWNYWFLGSCLGAIPLVPWAIYVFKHPVPLHEHVFSGLQEIVQLKFWVFWLSNPLGLHLGNALGLLRGQGNLEQLSDFFRYPIFFGRATYIVALAHLAILILALMIYSHAIKRLFWHSKNQWRNFVSGKASETAFAISAALWGFGFLMTLSSVNIRRYYMMAAFPFDLVWMARLGASGWGSRSRWILGSLWAGQLVISAAFVGYIHVNEGSIQGDYGPAYHLIVGKPKTESVVTEPSSNPKETPAAPNRNLPTSSNL